MLNLVAEVLNEEEYGSAADVWGLGCIAYEMLSMTFLWESKVRMLSMLPTLPMTSIAQEMLAITSLWKSKLSMTSQCKLFMTSLWKISIAQEMLCILFPWNSKPQLPFDYGLGEQGLKGIEDPA